ncbi:hypothetical protein EON66_11505 [archaeon]|nr:MAG: hypothetical protein EON66_11505 [archaeon]
MLVACLLACTFCCAHVYAARVHAAGRRGKKSAEAMRGDGGVKEDGDELTVEGKQRFATAATAADDDATAAVVTDKHAVVATTAASPVVVPVVRACDDGARRLHDAVGDVSPAQVDPARCV